jgi:hypothetical protein
MSRKSSGARDKDYKVSSTDKKYEVHDVYKSVQLQSLITLVLHMTEAKCKLHKEAQSIK